MFFYITIGVIVVLIIIAKLTQVKPKVTKVHKKLSDENKAIINENLKIVKKLPENLKESLYRDTATFIETTDFNGEKGLEITDEIRVTIAAQACLLTLNKPVESFKELHTVVVHPTALHSEVHHDKSTTVRSGESWVGGKVVLSWNSSKHGAYNAADGRNVVLHEFAHQLDQDDGRGDGVPDLKTIEYSEWAQVLGSSYNDLLEAVAKNRKSFLNKYGATNPAEFFAVVTEYFYEKPNQLKYREPELYDIFCEFYKIDPAEWK